MKRLDWPRIKRIIRRLRGAMSAKTHWDRQYADAVQSQWTQNPIVGDAVMRRMTGTPKYWLNWAFDDYLKTKPKRLLSIGCGDGGHELIIGRQRYAEQVDAFDASTVGIARAKEAAAKDGLSIRFAVDDFDSFAARRDEDRVYDLVMFTGSLHHVKNLEPMLDKVRRILKPDGLVMFNEYVGPCYNIYPQSQVRIVDRVLASIDPKYKLSPDRQHRNPTIDSALGTDPSESVRSALLLEFLGFYFDFRLRRPMGGALLHPLFTHLNAKTINADDPAAQATVRLLVAMEDELTAAGALANDFCFGFCAQKR